MTAADDIDSPAAEAAVPEQVPSYVCAVAGSQPCRLGACVGYRSDDQLVLVGYPLHDPRDEGALGLAVAAGWVPEASAPASASSVAGRLRALQEDVGRLARWNDPRGVYAHCLCGED